MTSEFCSLTRDEARMYARWLVRSGTPVHPRTRTRLTELCEPDNAFRDELDVEVRVREASERREREDRAAFGAFCDRVNAHFA